MLKPLDVTADPTAPEMARLSPEWCAEAEALGFSHDGWIASIFDGRFDSPGARRYLLSGVYAHRDGRMLLELSSEPFHDAAVKTLFEDGTVLITETKPAPEHWRKVAAGIFPHARHRIDLDVYEASTLAELVTRHEERVEAYEALGLRVHGPHDRRAMLAMKRRWREVADPRMRRQVSIAGWLGGGTFLSLLGGAFALMRLVPDYAGLFSLLFFVAAPAGFGMFTWSLLYLAPRFAKGAPAPAPRPASELLGLADEVEKGLLPRQRVTPEPPKPAPVRVSKGALRADLALAVAEGAAFPLIAALGYAFGGTAVSLLAVAGFFLLQAASLIVTKRPLFAHVRDKAVPELVRAESVCTGPACAVAKWAPWLQLAFAFACLYAANKAATLPPEPLTTPLVVQAIGITAFLVFTAVVRTRRRHAQFARV